MKKQTRTDELMKEIKKIKKVLEKDTWSMSYEEIFSMLGGELKGRQEMLKEVLKVIDKYKNPYPKDVFIWNNDDKLDFDRGRFNKFIFEIVENMRFELRQEIMELKTSQNAKGVGE